MSSSLHLLSAKTSQRHTLHLIQSARYYSKIFWTYLHLGSLHRVIAVFPVVPGHLSTIQIGVVAISVPPGACTTQGTASPTVVIILGVPHLRISSTDSKLRNIKLYIAHKKQGHSKILQRSFHWLG